MGHAGLPGVQIRALHAMAVSRPPPSAMDSTAATVGLGPLSSREQKLSLILQHTSTVTAFLRLRCLAAVVVLA